MSAAFQKLAGPRGRAVETCRLFLNVEEAPSSAPRAAGVASGSSS
eukprot:CAMPEP_0119271920 /NCGR_PEP_ID=MMETSP1329-20130426/8317_1 /TAXON_ID=114041 /ORGANISM="Genus nov. species nov., Strain RCC1024" /LENGTH=44 /DNA_ID= /DNA_START= /DNA_END= /DNA_ORIENTATION=